MNHISSLSLDPLCMQYLPIRWRRRADGQMQLVSGDGPSSRGMVAASEGSNCGCPSTCRASTSIVIQSEVLCHVRQDCSSLYRECVSGPDVPSSAWRDNQSRNTLPSQWATVPRKWHNIVHCWLFLFVTILNLITLLGHWHCLAVRVGVQCWWF